MKITQEMKGKRMRQIKRMRELAKKALPPLPKEDSDEVKPLNKLDNRDISNE